jgi:hypothetical protein
MASLEELAAKAAKKPYLVELGGQVLASIAHPSLTTWIEAWRQLVDAPAAEEVPVFLRALGVDEAAAQAAGGALAEMPAGTVKLLLDDMKAAFGLGN